MKKHDLAEFVSPGHPDRLADGIAEAIVEEAISPPQRFSMDCRSLAGVEVAVHDATVFIDGRIAKDTGPDFGGPRCVEFERAVDKVYDFAGYGSLWGPDAKDLEIIVRVCEEVLSPEESSIRPFSDDQNVVHGYAIDRPLTNYLPTAHWLAHQIGWNVWQIRSDRPESFGPDFKVFVDITDDGKSVEWRRLILSLQHAAGISMEQQHRTLLPLLAGHLAQLEDLGLSGVASSFRPSHLILNGAGDFIMGGPRGDNGLSGKKLVVDHYGPSVPIGGGAMVGKDPWKVDRCGALRSRQLAKRLVSAGYHEARVTCGWAPGESIPSLRDALVRTAPGQAWQQLSPSQLPRPEWFAIETIVKDLELIGQPWRNLTAGGTFIDPQAPWEHP